MMKTAIGFFLLSTVSSIAANAQDLFLQTRIEQRTLSAIIDKTRILMSNSLIDDHLRGEIEYKDNTHFTIDELTNNAQSVKLKELFKSVFKLDLTNASIRIRVPKIAYQVEELHANPTDLNVQDPILDLGVTATIRGLTTTLSAGVDFDFMVMNPSTQQTESYLTGHLNPTTVRIPNTIEPISFDLRFETKRDQQFTYNLKSYDFSTIPAYVNTHMNEFSITESDQKTPISAKSLTINPVSVRLGNLSRTVQFDSFKPLIQKKMNTMIASILSKLGVSIQNKIGPKILKGVFSNKTRSNLLIKNENLYTQFNISHFSQPTPNQLYLGVIGELCTAESYQQYHEQCNEHGNFPAPVRSISDGVRLKAKSEITEHIARGDSDLILSLSEEYLNRLLYTSIQANLWNAMLEKKHLAMGPKGAFIVFNQRSQSPELYLDLFYLGEGKGIENLLINEDKPLRFPMRISTTLDFINQNGIPHLVLKTQKVLSDLDEIIHGIPEYDLPSNLIFGLKKKIARMILEMSADIQGQTAVDMELPVLKNIDLEKTWHETSPFGRLNLFFKL